MKKVLCLILCLILVAAVTMITASADGDPETVTVTVITYEEMNPMYQIVWTYGDPFTAPVTVLTQTDDGVFGGWYTDMEYTERYEDGTRLYKDMTLYPRYVPEDELVTVRLFAAVDDENPIETIQYVKGDIPFYRGELENEDPDLQFIGWYSDKEYRNRIDFSEPLSGNVDLYARFVTDDDIVYLTIYLFSTTVPTASGTYVKGDIPDVPDDPGPPQEDMCFMGWYADPEYSTPFDFSRPLMSDVSIYSRFVAEEDIYYAALYLDAADETPTTYLIAAKGDPCPKPADPGKDNLVFTGWYFDRELTIPADFTTPRSTDCSLFPKWVSSGGQNGLRRIEAQPATATADGVKTHYENEETGKWYELVGETFVEITDRDALTIDAVGPYLIGDPDGDGAVTILDATTVQRKLADLPLVGTYCRGAANSDGDQSVSILDATAIQRYLAELPTNENIGKNIS